MKEIINKLNFIKIKHFCFTEDTVERMERQATDWEKVFVNYTSDNDYYSKCTKNSLNSTVKNPNNLIKKYWPKTLRRRYTDGK